MNNYEKFYQLHHNEQPFVLGNAWNVKSAQLIEQNGYASIGTSSGAISNSMGYTDGENIPFNELLYVVKRITACTGIPVSVDLERGYTDDLTTLTEYIQQLLDCGVAGINLEDAQGQDVYLKKIHAIKNYLEKTNQHLFINARTDVFLQKSEAPLERAIKRAKLYAEAGADGLFVPAVSDPDSIKTLSSSINLPLNIVGTPKLSSEEALAVCGVKRISMAVFLYNATYGKLDHFLREVREQKSFQSLF